jgi:hypothetical protein
MINKIRRYKTKTTVGRKNVVMVFPDELDKYEQEKSELEKALYVIKSIVELKEFGIYEKLYIIKDECNLALKEQEED